jgi:hypothetical protein
MLNTSVDTLDKLVRNGQGPKRIDVSSRRAGFRLADVRHYQVLRERESTAS